MHVLSYARAHGAGSSLLNVITGGADVTSADIERANVPLRKAALMDAEMTSPLFAIHRQAGPLFGNLPTYVYLGATHRAPCLRESVAAGHVGSVNRPRLGIMSGRVGPVHFLDAIGSGR